MYPQRAGVKARVVESACQWMQGDGKAVDGADEIPAVMTAVLVLLQTSLAEFGEKAGETIGDVGALGLIGGQEDQQVGIATPQPDYKASGA